MVVDVHLLVLKTKTWPDIFKIGKTFTSQKLI